MTSQTLETIPNGDIFSVPGLKGGAVETGVKPSGLLDLAVIVADEPMSVAGMFTTSAVAAPPVRVCQERLAASRTVRSIVVNSGNANALTGKQGRRDAETMVARLEERCGGPGLVLSTGVIGVPLPIDRVLAGIDAASAELSPQNEKVSRAILTTDTGPKTVAVSVETEGGRFTVGGIAKGSGMIHPNMATMLAVIATDAPIDPVALKTILARAVDRSFHEISVDGDTSTNDAVLLLAGQPSPTADVDLDVLEAAITHVARDLASQIVRDGEGVSRVMEIEVHSAKSPDEARSVAESIARSSLVKTALAGGDPNWGRILSAAGASGAPISPSGLTLELGDHVVFEKGAVVSADERELAETFAADEVSVRLGLGRGDALARMVTTDLTRRYVEINSEYTT